MSTVQEWDYDGKDFYKVTSGVRRYYEVPPKVSDEVRPLLPDMEAIGPILLKACKENRLGPVLHETPVPR